MKFKNKMQMVMAIAAVIAIVFLFIYPSVSIGIVSGFGFSYLNLKLVYKNMDDVFNANEGVDKIKTSMGNTVIRFAILSAFVYISVHYPQIFNIAGIGIGMFLALIGTITSSRKKDENG